MGLRDNDSKPSGPANCWDGYAIATPIRLISSKGIVEIGVKTFHCMRRYSYFKKTSECPSCGRDMTAECFKIKPEYSAIPVNTLILYCQNKRSSVSATIDILPSHPYFQGVEKIVFPDVKEGGLTNQKKSGILEQDDLGMLGNVFGIDSVTKTEEE